MANNDTETETPVEPEETTVDDTEEEAEQEQDKQFDFASELQRMESNFEKKLSKMQKAIARDKQGRLDDIVVKHQRVGNGAGRVLTVSHSQSQISQFHCPDAGS